MAWRRPQYAPRLSLATRSAEPLDGDFVATNVETTSESGCRWRGGSLRVIRRSGARAGGNGHQPESRAVERLRGEPAPDAFFPAQRPGATRDTLTASSAVVVKQHNAAQTKRHACMLPSAGAAGG